MILSATAHSLSAGITILAPCPDLHRFWCSVSRSWAARGKVHCWLTRGVSVELDVLLAADLAEGRGDVIVDGMDIDSGNASEMDVAG